MNDPKAPVHILENHIAVVTLAIFNLFLDKNALKKRLYEKRAGNKRIYTVLQREIEQLDIHQKGMNGQNIVIVTVEGLDQGVIRCTGTGALWTCEEVSV